MGLFNFGKKNEEKNTCTCGCSAGTATEGIDTCCKATDGICCIKVLGAGCASCHKLYENAKEAVTDAGLSLEVDYITDMEKIMEYGVMSTPALVINDKVVSQGKLLKAADIAKLLHG